MSLAIFSELPDVPKRLIIESLFTNTQSVELGRKSLPIRWLFSAPDEELGLEEEFSLDSGLSLWVDTWRIESIEVDYLYHTHLATYAGILLATHWGLVDRVYLKPLEFSYLRGYRWLGSESSIPCIFKTDFEEFRKYLGFCASVPIELDPFMIKEFKDTTYRLEKVE